MSDATEHSTIKTVKFLRGWYRVSGEHYFSNVKREREHKDQWSADIRLADSGDLIQYAGLWPTKRDAIEEAVRVISSKDRLFTPSRAEQSPSSHGRAVQ